MTVPGGVPNLPAAALTLETLAEKLQDQTAATMRSLASQRIPSVFDVSNGGSILSDLTPFGIITRIWAEVNSAIARADPADITGPEDIPPLLFNFVEGLPFIGELVGLLEAIGGTYTGDDAVLLAVQEIFYPIRKLLQLFAGQDVGFPTAEEVTAGWVHLGSALADAAGLAEAANTLAGLAQAAADAAQSSTEATQAQINALLFVTGQATTADVGALINDSYAVSGNLQQILTATGAANGIVLGALIIAAKDDAAYAQSVLQALLASWNTTANQASTWGTSLMQLLGQPTGMNSGTPAVSTSVGATPVLLPMLNYVNDNFDAFCAAIGVPGLSEAGDAVLSAATQAAEAADNFAAMFVAAGVANVPAYNAWLLNTNDQAVQALNDFTDLLTQTEVATAADLAAMISAANTSGLKFADTLSSLGITTSTQLVALLNSFPQLSAGLLNPNVLPSLGLSWAGTIDAGLLTGALGNTILTQIANLMLSLIPNKDSGIPAGFTGLQDVFTDIVNSMGISSGLGSGSPIYVAAGSIPIYGPLIDSYLSQIDSSGVIQQVQGAVVTGVTPIEQALANGIGQAVSGVQAFVQPALNSVNQATAYIQQQLTPFIPFTVPRFW